jgi:hypothetical protein
MKYILEYARKNNILFRNYEHLKRTGFRYLTNEINILSDDGIQHNENEISNVNDTEPVWQMNPNEEK